MIRRKPNLISNDLNGLTEELSGINDVLFEQTSVWNPISTADVPSSQKGSGYYWTDGIYHENAQYTYIAYEITIDTEIYAESPYTTAILCEYNSETFNASTLVRCVSKQAAGLPTQANPWSIQYGHWVVLSHKSVSDNKTIFVKTIEKSVIRQYTGKVWAVVGDSWTAINSYANKRYFDYISEELGFTIDNCGVSGTGYQVNAGIANGEFYNRVNNIGTPDIVTIFGSGNDCVTDMVIGDVTDSEPTTICGAINSTITAYLASYPNTPMGIIAPAPWRHDGFYPANPNSRMTTYVAAMRAVCERRAVPFLDLYHESGLYPEIESNRAEEDKVYYNTNHINDKGQQIIYPKIREFIKKLI